MKYSVLYICWGVLFVLCAALGFVPQPQGVLYGVLVVLGLAFFVPGILVLYTAAREGRRDHLLLVRNLCIGSLTLSLSALVANLLSTMASDTVGSALYGILVIVSAPMACIQVYALSLFLWACLLMASLQLLRRK